MCMAYRPTHLPASNYPHQIHPHTCVCMCVCRSAVLRRTKRIGPCAKAMALIQCILAVGVQLWWQISCLLSFVSQFLMFLLLPSTAAWIKSQDEPRMQVASTFRSPFKEIILFCMCVGVLWGGLLVEQASRRQALNVLDANALKDFLAVSSG